MEKTNYKGGYLDRPDPLRTEAEKLFGYDSSGPEVIESKSAASKESRRLFKKGGSVQKANCSKYAMGGASKVRMHNANKKKKGK